MKKLLEEMEKNPELKAKIEELDQKSDSVPQDYIKVAAEYGVELKEEDFQPADGQGQVSDDELDAVAGGDKCACAVGGGGSGNSFDKVCACVVGGGGEYTDKIDQLGGTAKTRCTCVLVGSGDAALDQDIYW